VEDSLWLALSVGLALTLELIVTFDVERDGGLISAIGDVDWEESCGKGMGC
jgi:hypothetical protein